MLTEHKTLSSQEIIKRVQKKITVTELTINICLFLLSVNGLVSDQYVGASNYYKITEDGNQFLIKYEQAKTKILELRYTSMPYRAFLKKAV
jgi:predicted transcriptional regulator